MYWLQDRTKNQSVETGLTRHSKLHSCCSESQKLSTFSTDDLISLYIVIDRTHRKVVDLHSQMQELRSLTVAITSLTALYEDEKWQRLALAVQVASLQQQLIERDQAAADMQAQLQVANEELHAAQSTAESTAASLELALSRETAVVAEMGDAMQRAAQAEQELARLSSVVADLEQQLAAARAISTTRPPLPSPLPARTPPATQPESNPQQHAALVSECDIVIAQRAHVPALRDAIQQRDQLQAEFAALKASKSDFAASVKVGRELKALQEAILQLPLSEEDYLTMADRYAALVQKMTVLCERLLENEDLDALEGLASKLEELQALDVSALPQSWANDPVQPPTPPAPSTSAEEGEDECANDPVYVSPHAGEITLT
jgi:DNA repair exonuclease SbcCD ATPase subunit